jgi:streptogramin lyase
MRCGTVLLALALAVCSATTAAAQPTVTEFTGGVTTGFSADTVPVGITVGPDGNLWVAAEGNSLTAPAGYIEKVTPAGHFTEFTGGVTPNFTANLGPEDITAAPDGNLWFSQYKNPGAIGRISPAGDVTEFTAGFTANGDGEFITVGPDGNLWFTLSEAPGHVVRMTTAGVATEFTAGATAGFPANVTPAGITAGPDGNLYFVGVSNPGHVFRVTPSGTFTEIATGGVTPGFSTNGDPLDITTGPDGNLWFTEQLNGGRIARMPTDGSSVTEFVQGVTPGFTTSHEIPREIEVGPDGNIWVGLPGNSSAIARVTSAGVVTTFLGGTTPGFSKLGGPAHMVAGPDGNLWFAAPINPGRVSYITVGPRVITGAAGSIGPTAATLTGTVRPNGQTTTYHFEYGTTAAYGSQTADAPLTAGVATIPVNATPSDLQPNTIYHFRLVATNDSATTVGDDATFTTAPTPLSPPPPVATVAAASSLALTPATFRAAPSGPSAVAARHRIGARVTFTLNIAASVRFKAQRRATGRRAGTRCVAPTKRNRSARRCTRYVAVRGGFARNGIAGRNAFRFTGRMSAKKLRPGRYRLIATPTAAGKTGTPARAPFRIVRR